MTLIHFNYSDSYRQSSHGSLAFMPHRRHAANETTILPKPFAIHLHNGERVVDLQPSDVDWVWMITERINNTTNTWFATIPDQDGTIEHTELIHINPSSLPAAYDAVEPAWWAEHRQYQRLVGDTVTTAKDAIAEAESILQIGTDSADQARYASTVAKGYRDESQNRATESRTARDEAITAKNDAIAAADRAEAPTDEMVGALIGQQESSTKTALDNAMSQKLGVRMSRTHIIHRDGLSNSMVSGSDDYVTFDSIYHVYDGANNVTGYLYGLSRLMTGGMEQSIWRSKDVGKTWEKLFTMPIDQPSGVWYEDLFVTIDEVFHLQKTTTGYTTPRNNYVDSFNIHGYQTNSLNVGNSYWLGATQSMDNGHSADWSTRVTMFGEYALDGKETVNIWRSTNNGVTWDVALSLPGNNGVVGSGEVRHAHAVNFDPYTSHWWASFGDMNHQCKIYRSTDNGLTWDLMWEGTQRERTCGFVFTVEYIYYGMDEAKATTDHSKIVRINKATMEREDVATIKDGLPVFQLTKTYAPEGFIVWPMYERAASYRPERVTVQWFDSKTHKLYDLASYLIEGEESMEGFRTAGRAQDTRDGSVFFEPTPNIQYAGGQGYRHVSVFSRGVITEE